MAKVQRDDSLDLEDFTDKIPMGDLTEEGHDYIIVGFEFKDFGDGNVPCVLLEGKLHQELKPIAMNKFIDAYGDETDAWTGRVCNVRKKKFPKGFGRLPTPDESKEAVEVGGSEEEAPF